MTDPDGSHPMEPSFDDSAGDVASVDVPGVDVEEVGKEVSKGIKRPLKPLSKRKVENYNEGLKKRGVVYLSRVPPFMKPAKVKHLMEQHGVVTRVSLLSRDGIDVATNCTLLSVTVTVPNTKLHKQQVPYYSTL